jgi:subtilisin family serine protease
MDLLRGVQGVHALEQSNTVQSVGGSVIVEFREPAVLSTYARILERNQAAGVARRSLSISESDLLERQRARAIQEQDFVLNRLAATAAGSSAAGQSRSSKALFAPITRFHTAINAVVLQGVSLGEVEGIIQADPEISARVLRVVSDTSVYASLTTSVAEIHAPEVWRLPSSEGIPLTGSGVRIGILDTGVDYRHPDLGGCFGSDCKVAGGYDFINQDNDPIDDHGHGTHCAAIAAGDGTYIDDSGTLRPLRGVAPGATIYSYKVLSKDGSGMTSGIIRALERCADPNQDNDFSDHLDVCSLSLGGPGSPDDALSMAVDATSRAGVVVVAAAGNSGSLAGTISSPGTARLAITVAAACKSGDTGGVCSQGPIASFSSRGPIPGFSDVIKPDVAAPGVRICAARHASFAEGAECLDGTRVAISGTSMATPHVAGVAALLIQAHPSFSTQQIKEAILSSATDLGQSRESQGTGLVNTHKALQELGFPNPIARIEGAPVEFDVHPTTSFATVSRTVRLTSRTNESLSFSASLSTEQPGVQLKISPEQVTLASGESVTFTLEAKLDLNQVPSGQRWRGRLKFSAAQGALEAPIYGVVHDRVSADITSIDLGVKNGNDVTWKDGKTLRLRNFLQDASTTYKVSVSCCGLDNKGTSPGYRASSGLSSIELPPGGYVDVPLVVEATGVQVENGTYQGWITFSSSLQNLSVPIKFFRGWAFRYMYEADAEPPEAAVLHTKNDFLYHLPEKGQRESVFLVKSAGPWQADVVFKGLLSSADPEFVFKVDQTAIQTTNNLAFARSEPRQLVMVRPRHANGALIKNGLSLFSVGNRHGQPYLLLMSFDGGGDAGFRAWINTFHPAIKAQSSSYDVHGSTITTWQHVALGDSREGDIVLRDGPFITKYISPPSHELPTEATKALAYSCVEGNCWQSVGSQARIEPGEVGIVHASANEAVSPDDALFAEVPRFYLSAAPFSVPDDDYWNSNRRIAGYWYVSSKGAYGLVAGSGGVPYREGRFSKDFAVQVGYEEGLGFGAGPQAYVGSWYTYPGKLSYFGSRYGYWAPSYISSGGVADYYNQDPTKRIALSLYRNGSEYFTAKLNNVDPVVDLLRPGQYRSSLKRAAQSGGLAVATESENTFKVVSLEQHQKSPQDQNPPTLRHLAIVAKGVVQDVLDPTETNTLYFGIDPRPGFLRPATSDGDYDYDLMGDGLQSVLVEYSIDGVDWTSLSHETVSENEFKAVLPMEGLRGTNRYRISVQDFAGNTFRHTFEVAVGRSLIIPTPTPGSDDTPPAWPTGTPTVSPTITATPDYGSDNSAATLPKPRASTKNGKWVVSLPRIAAIAMDAERASALNQLLAAGLSSEEVAKYSDITKVRGECLLLVKRGRKTKSTPVTLAFLRGRRVSLPISSKVRSLRILYGCQFYSAKPYNLLLGPARKSPEIVTSRSSRSGSNRNR